MKKIRGPEGIPAAKHLYGLLWVHDIIPWPACLNAAPFDQGGRAKDAFGWTTTRNSTGTGRIRNSCG